MHTHINSLRHFPHQTETEASTRRPVIDNAERPSLAGDVFAAGNPGVNVSRLEVVAVVNEKFEVETALRDEKQRFRESKDVKKTDKFRDVAMKTRKHTGRAKVANKQTLAELRNKEARRRLPGAVPGVLGRGGLGSGGIQAVGRIGTVVSAWHAKLGATGMSLRVMCSPPRLCGKSARTRRSG